MSIIKKISDQIYYFLDSTKVVKLRVKIEHFKFNHVNDDISVFYRLGRQKLLNKMELNQFSNEYFEKLSNYDQHRLTKFETLQDILRSLFSNENCSKNALSGFIEEKIKNEHLF